MAGGKSRKSGHVSKKLIDRIKKGEKCKGGNCNTDKRKGGGLGISKKG